ncbi:uncharacterized protein LOC132316271 [Cornus florida]|uniref:uncharacterized protein LOC132316271 n=1 Tax=Cornus florida TaxID=4283 RepID=UPI00289CBB10|nr:uncharacterized protein LOC132316271 [Cornus florida]
MVAVEAVVAVGLLLRGGGYGGGGGGGDGFGSGCSMSKRIRGWIAHGKNLGFLSEGSMVRVSEGFTINVGPVSSIVISNKLNNVKILEIFPNLDACTAFAFVFNGDTTQKYVGPRSLMQETQITGSLLGNLLDVVEEVQLAQLELQNLIQTSFNSSSVEQLDLQLCFINFHSGRKAMLILDMSCLNRYNSFLFFFLFHFFLPSLDA